MIPISAHDSNLVQTDPILAQLSHQQPFATLQTVDDLIDTYFGIIGKLFYVLERDIIDATLQDLRASGYATTPLSSFFSRNYSLRVRTQVAELAGMAAIAVIHAQLMDPENSPPIELADQFYTIAKHGLDFALQFHPVRAMKVAALVSMYNIVVHATVALSYAGKQSLT